MQITNSYQPKYQPNYQPNFRAAKFDKEALEFIADRVPAGRFNTIIESFKDKYKNTKMNIRIGVLPGKLKRLDAMIHYNNAGEHVGQGVFFEHIEEGVFKSLFCSPETFFKKVGNIYREKAVPFINNGFHKIG